MTPESAPPARGHVLFADDDRAAREGIAEMLRRKGFACDTAGNAAEALEKLQAGRYEALLSDINMPGNSGLELVESLARIAPGLPVILITGRPSVETAARSVRLPVTAYLTKPPDLEDLARVLDQAIAEYRDLRLIQDGRARLRDWQAELDQIEQRMNRSSAPRFGEAALEGFVHMSLRQAILALTDLERAMQALDRRGGGKSREVEQVAALRRAVDVLERTRQNFKSKDLADLRRQLEQVLARDSPDPGR